MADKFPYIVGQSAEIFSDGEWKKGKIVAGYRFRDGVVTIETDDGEMIWCGESRKELYRPIVREMTREEKIVKIARHYGYDAQSRKLTEEIGELLQAMNKYWCHDLKHGKNIYNPWDGYMPQEAEYWSLIEEIADVEVMLAQLKFFLSAEEEVEKIIEDKIDRQIARMDEENADKNK